VSRAFREDLIPWRTLDISFVVSPLYLGGSDQKAEIRACTRTCGYKS